MSKAGQIFHFRKLVKKFIHLILFVLILHVQAVIAAVEELSILKSAFTISVTFEQVWLGSMQPLPTILAPVMVYLMESASKVELKEKWRQIQIKLK